MKKIELGQCFGPA